MKNLMKEIEKKIADYKKFGYKSYSQEKKELGNNIINSFKTLQVLKSNIIIECESENFEFLKADLEERNELEFRMVVLRNVGKKNGGKFSYLNIKDMNVSEFYTNYSFVVSLEKKYFYNTEVLQIISLQQKIIEVMNDNIHYLIKKFSNETVSMFHHSRNCDDIENELLLYSIKKLYSYDNSKNGNFTTYITYELKNQRHIFVSKVMKEYALEYDENRTVIDDIKDEYTELSKTFVIDETFKKMVKSSVSESEYITFFNFVSNNKETTTKTLNKDTLSKIQNLMVSNNYISF
jgi:hypothetical protein